MKIVDCKPRYEVTNSNLSQEFKEQIIDKKTSN